MILEMDRRSRIFLELYISATSSAFMDTITQLSYIIDTLTHLQNILYAALDR